jgi:hypothetical protein
MSHSFMPFCRRAGLALVAAAGLTSCLDIEQNLVLNPDGSGRVTMTTAVAMPDLDGLGGLGGLGGLSGDDESKDGSDKKPKPREQAREIAVSLLRAEGIEAWSEVSYGVDKAGRTHASVTGYFPDVTKVRLSNPMGGEEKEDMGVSKNADGHWVFEDSLDDDDDAAGKPDVKEEPADDTAEKPAPMTDEEVQDKLDEERQQWAGMKAFMSAFFDSLRIAMSVQGGGTIVETAIFEKKDDRTAALEFTGKKLVASIDALLQDDEKAKAMIRKGISPTDSGGGPDEFFKMMFGGDGKMRVTLKPGEPAFDYAAAVAKAKAGVTPELKSLLEDAKKPAKKSGLPGLSLPGLEGSDEGEPDESGDDEGTDDSSPGKKPRRID